MNLSLQYVCGVYIYGVRVVYVCGCGVCVCVFAHVCVLWCGVYDV